MPLYPFYLNQEDMKDIDKYQEFHHVPLAKVPKLIKNLGMICIQHRLTEAQLEVLLTCKPK